MPVCRPNTGQRMRIWRTTNRKIIMFIFRVLARIYSYTHFVNMCNVFYVNDQYFLRNLNNLSILPHNSKSMQIWIDLHKTITLHCLRKFGSARMLDVVYKFARTPVILFWTRKVLKTVNIHGCGRHDGNMIKTFEQIPFRNPYKCKCASALQNLQ